MPGGRLYVRRCAAVAAVSILTIGAAATDWQRSRKPVTHTVTIDATRFQPETLTVKPGDFVLWINKDVIPHTATSQAGGFHSGTIAAGASWKQAFKTKGEFDYICSFHPTMKARLRVK